jgi:predicted RNA binding protein YcfA (HicA-like mRNA interferase family)
LTRRKKKAGTGKITPLKAAKLVRIFMKTGYEVSWQTGSHIVMRHPDRSLNLVIPSHKGQDVQPEIIRSLIKKAGLSKDEFLELL